MIVAKDSPIHQMGVFATRLIPKGTFIIEYVGERITWAEAEKREVANRQTGATYIMEIDESYCVDGAVNGNDSRFINHSCDPNCEITGDGDRLLVVSTRDIQPDEELTFDYAFPHDDVDRNPCRCGSSGCRGYLQELPPVQVAAP